MGEVISKFSKDIEVTIKTGEVRGAGTNSNVYLVLIDEAGNRSPKHDLDCTWKDDFESGCVDTFTLKNISLGKITEIEIFRDGNGLYDHWFVEYVFVKQKGITYEFPLHRWIQANRKYNFTMYDSILPQDDPYPDQRKQEMGEKRELYKFGVDTGMPRQISEIPAEMQFSSDYERDLALLTVKLLAGKTFIDVFEGDWDDLNDVDDIYKCSFGLPKGAWNWESDHNFGEQRFQGVAPHIIRLCEEIPEKFPVTAEMVEPSLDGKSLADALKDKEIYIIDLKVLDGIICKDNRTLCPAMALFHATKQGTLMPIAIQLFQTPSPQNPIFLPTDPQYTWMLAKMYFNNGEAALHESALHLGLTHMAAETICVSVNRCLSPSHPVHRLLAPHFLYLLPINKKGIDTLLAPGGWIDSEMTAGSSGSILILKKVWSTWRLNVEGWLPADLKDRGVDDMNLLKGYYYRNDGIRVHKAIWDYVKEVLNKVYVNPKKLQEDYEVQELARFLVAEDGAAMKGIFGAGKFDHLEDLMKFVTATICISSMTHAAVNFGQYDEYAFPPNYPPMLNGAPPRNKVAITEADIVSQIPSKSNTLNVMTITKLLSTKSTNSLGNFEIQYQYNPEALKAVANLQHRLKKISEEIDDRNKKLNSPYNHLNPKFIPNAISI